MVLKAKADMSTGGNTVTFFNSFIYLFILSQLLPWGPFDVGTVVCKTVFSEDAKKPYEKAAE